MSFTEFDLDLLRYQMNAIIQILVAAGVISQQQAMAFLEKKTQDFIQKRRKGEPT
jgi:hypothetical protein